MTEQPEFGRRLRALRTKRRMSQRQLAGDLITPSYVSLLESGDRVPTLDVVIHFANVLQVPASELLGTHSPLVTAMERIDQSSVLTGSLALSATEEHDYATALETLEQAMEEARAEGSSLRQFDVGMRLQQLLGTIGDQERRVELLRRLMNLPGLSMAEEFQVVLHTDLAIALREVGSLPAARTAAAEALDRIQGTPLAGSGQHVKLLGVFISTLVELRDLDLIEGYVATLLELAYKGGGQALQGRANWVAALAYARLGKAETARTHLRLAHESLASPSMPLREWLRFCRVTASVLLEIGGDLPGVRRWLNNAESTAQMLDIPYERQRVAALQAQYELAAGNPTKAKELIDQILADPTGLPQTDQLQMRLTQANALSELGDREAAIAAMRQLALDHENAGIYQTAVKLWRRIDQLRSD